MSTTSAMTPADPDQLSPTAKVTQTFVEIALEAGRLILTIYGQDFAVQTKADCSPVTAADIAAEALILERLAAGFPSIPVVAEEATAKGDIPDLADRFILVDPLDGSREFIARNGEFTVNIALIDNGIPIAGVVYAPALHRIWWGSGADGAFAASVNDGVIVDPVRVAVRSAPKGGLTLVGSRSHAGGEGNIRLEGLSVARFAAHGSSLKFCILAEGGADLYPRFSRTMEWDTAAGDAVLRAAGGQVIDAAGVPLRYGKRRQAKDSDFANAPFWAVGDKTLGPVVCKRPQKDDE